jgi:hypothetical protein
VTGTSTGVLLRSFKLRLADGHVRIVPSTDAAGCPFAGPGVDLLGEAAQEAFRVAAPLLAVLADFEPGIAVRSLAVDLERPRLTATLHADGRPRVVRIEAGAALTRLLAETPALTAYLAGAAERALAAREAGATSPGACTGGPPRLREERTAAGGEALPSLRGGAPVGEPDPAVR